MINNRDKTRNQTLTVLVNVGIMCMINVFFFWLSLHVRNSLENEAGYFKENHGMIGSSLRCH